MFHPSMDVPAQKELLADVLDNGEIVRQPYTPSAKYRSDGLQRWERLRTELMHENRYFPDAKLNTDRLKELFALLHADDVPLEWYRARLQTADTIFRLEEMGAPPRRIAGHGRANPAGIPYLYLGSTPETAVSETRPHPGEKACVADFTIPAGLTLLDLRNPRALVSPFDLGDEDQIGLLRSDIDFLERLGEELTRPILPQGAMIDYVPSQYLCEFIKKCGYAGLIYRSSVSEGINLALFNPTLANPLRVRPYVIQRVSVTVQAI
jgi:RES domain